MATPQRPTENITFTEVIYLDGSWSYTYRPGLWFDPDEITEIEHPADEPPEHE